MRFIFLLIFLDSLFCNLALNLNTIEYVENNLEPTLELSSAVLANKPLIKVPEHFILCSSHFQSDFNTKNTYTIYVLYQDENMTIPWLNIGFWQNEQLWLNVMQKDGWFVLGNLESQNLFEWIHICLEIDMVNETVSASINGKKYGVTNTEGINPSVDFAFNIRLGIVHTSWGKSKFQFHGKITNIQLFLPIIEDIAYLSKNLCITRDNIDILSWSNMKWKYSGTKMKVLETDSNLICPSSPYADVTIPLKWNKGGAVDMCRKLGNGKISTFQASSNGNEYDGYWTPYIYFVVEGYVRNEITKLKEELLWWPGFPVNRSDFSTIIYKKKYFWNVAENREECLICNTSLKTEYTLRGNCKYSFLGNLNYKTNTFNKYLGFFGKRATIWYNIFVSHHYLFIFINVDYD